MNTGHGGSYTINEAGERVLTVAPTADHPQGNGPRAAEAEVMQTPAPDSKPPKKTSAPAITPTE